MSNHLPSLQDRLSAWADEVRWQAETTAPGPEQDALFKKIAQADKTPELYNWINSPSFNRRSDRILPA